jgi:hypothetical protein
MIDASAVQSIIRTAQTDSVGRVVAELAGLAARVRSSTYMGVYLRSSS